MIFEEELFEAGFVTGLECPKIVGKKATNTLNYVVIAFISQTHAVAELFVPTVESDTFPL